MAMVPHGRSLVEKMQGQPFALLGVNFDESADALKQVEQANKITWRSFWAGGNSSIAERYNVRYFPTVIVLDAKGRIRCKGVRGDAIDTAVNSLLKEAAAP